MYKKYLNNDQLNFQINRFLEPYYSNDEVQFEIKKACQEITDLDSWFTQWNKLANKKRKLQLFDLAAAYYQLADFFLKESDPRKIKTYNLFKECFYQSISNTPVELIDVPYKNSFLPTAIIKQETANEWLVFHGGFDSYLEELIRLSITHLSTLKNYNILMFEGPGQGQVCKNEIPMTSKWEEPVSVILDFYHLKDVCLLGMSLGGYLALRAAAKEKRVTKVIAFDTFYCMEDSFLMNAPENISCIPNILDKKTATTINLLLDEYAKQNIDLMFKINKAKEIFGVETPAEILMEIKKYTLNGIEKDITQDVLLLAGSEDMYVPINRTNFLQTKMINASTVKAVIFDKSTGGQYHCQVGNKSIAFQEINNFLNRHQK